MKAKTYRSLGRMSAWIFLVLGLLAALTVAALADTTVATVNGIGYPTLEAAVNAAEENALLPDATAAQKTVYLANGVTLYPQAWVDDLPVDDLTDVDMFDDVHVFSGSSDGKASMLVAYSFHGTNPENGDEALVDKFMSAYAEEYSSSKFREDNAEALLSKGGFTNAECETLGNILTQVTPYLNWACDFEVSFNNPIVANQIALAGSFHNGRETAGFSFANGWWLGFPLPKDLAAGEHYRLLSDYSGGSIAVTYFEILCEIGIFDCGIVKGSEIEPGTTMTVELRMYDPNCDGVSIVIGEYQYTVKAQEITPVEPEDVEVTKSEDVTDADVEKAIEEISKNEAVSEVDTKIDAAIDTETKVKVDIPEGSIDLTLVMNALNDQAKADNKIQASESILSQETTDSDVFKRVVVDTIAITVEKPAAEVTVTELTFDVTPKIRVNVNGVEVETKLPNEAIKAPIFFRLPVVHKTATTAKVFHKGVFFGIYPVLTSPSGERYIELSAMSFSEYSYQLYDEDPVKNAYILFTDSSKVVLLSGVDSLNYDKVGFEISDTDYLTDTVYESVTVNTTSGNSKTYYPSDFYSECNYIFAQEFDSLDDLIQFTSFALSYKGERVKIHTSTLDKSAVGE